MYDGRTALKEGTVVGHEIMGVIETVGEAVKRIKEGDRVVLPFNVSCRFCFNCHRGHTEACLTMNPNDPHTVITSGLMMPRTRTAKFDKGIDGYTKVLIRFVENAAAAAD